MSGWRRRMHCHVQGHGTRCIAVWERGPGEDRYPRGTEKRLALRYEERAG